MISVRQLTFYLSEANTKPEVKWKESFLNQNEFPGRRTCTCATLSVQTCSLVRRVHLQEDRPVERRSFTVWREQSPTLMGRGGEQKSAHAPVRLVIFNSIISSCYHIFLSGREQSGLAVAAVGDSVFCAVKYCSWPRSLEPSSVCLLRTLWEAETICAIIINIYRWLGKG